MPKRVAHEAVLNGLVDRIESGDYAPGSRFPAERELATELLVSRSTIRTAIGELIAMGLLDQKANCRPTVRYLDRVQPTIPSGTQGRIAVWMREDGDDIGSTLILKGIRKLLGQAHRQLVVGHPVSDDFATVQRFADTLIADEEIKGVILWASDDARLLPIYRSLIEAGKSLVCIDRDPPGALNADVVAVDHFRGARTAIEHLLSQGHRRIGMVGNDDHVSSVRDRRDGYFSALRDAGIAWDEDLLREVEFIHSKDIKASAQSVIDHYLSLASPPTALFAVNDQVAMYLQDALITRGLSVPGDVSLVGFDWFLRWLPSGGDLTTVAQPFETIGEVAVRRLIERIDGAEPQHSRHILLPAPLVVKSTTRDLAPRNGRRTASTP